MWRGWPHWCLLMEMEFREIFYLRTCWLTVSIYRFFVGRLWSLMLKKSDVFFVILATDFVSHRCSRYKALLSVDIAWHYCKDTKPDLLIYGWSLGVSFCLILVKRNDPEDTSLSQKPVWPKCSGMSKNPFWCFWPQTILNGLSLESWLRATANASMPGWSLRLKIGDLGSMQRHFFESRKKPCANTFFGERDLVIYIIILYYIILISGASTALSYQQNHKIS